MTDNPTEALSQLQSLQKEHGDLDARLSIIRISEPISLDQEADSQRPSPSKRGSDVSILGDPTPSSLVADLTHYKVGVFYIFWGLRCDCV